MLLAFRLIYAAPTQAVDRGNSIVAAASLQESIVDLRVSGVRRVVLRQDVNDRFVSLAMLFRSRPETPCC